MIFLKIENYAGKLSRWQGQRLGYPRHYEAAFKLLISFKIMFSTFFMNQIYTDLELYFGMIWYKCDFRKD